MDRAEPKYYGLEKFKVLLSEDTSGIHPRLLALNLATRFLPHHYAPRFRAQLFSLAGFQIGQGTLIDATPKINGGANLFANLVVGRDCSIDVECVFDLGERITIGDRVTIGPGAMILTSTHELDFKEHRAGQVQLSPVTIGDGAWLGPRVVILPGVKVGAGSIINAGSVVTKEVVPNTRVGGVPATQLEVLET
ncbi:MAG: acyltransferase [Myxococcales bacterium]